MTKSPEELYQERVKRVKDAVQLKTPDRVPVFGPHQLYPYTFGGVTLKEAMYDYTKARKACHKFVDEFQPDLDFGPILAYPAKPMETLGLKYLKWPGQGLDDHVIYQYVEGEYMAEAEYDEFIKDPSDFYAHQMGAPHLFRTGSVCRFSHHAADDVVRLDGSRCVCVRGNAGIVSDCCRSRRTDQ